MPYKLSFIERGNMAGSIIVNAIEEIVPGITAPGLTQEQRRELAQHASVAGEPLYKQGFWNVLLRVISGEAYQLNINSGGYNSTLINWNAADAIPWYLSDFGLQAEYYGLRATFRRCRRRWRPSFSRLAAIFAAPPGLTASAGLIARTSYRQTARRSAPIR